MVRIRTSGVGRIDSNLAGGLSAAEVVKVLMRNAGDQNVPMLDNVLQLDLARDYGRHDRLSFVEPPRSDCGLCQARAELVAQLRAQRAPRGLDTATPLTETTTGSP